MSRFDKICIAALVVFASALALSGAYHLVAMAHRPDFGVRECRCPKGTSVRLVGDEVPDDVTDHLKGYKVTLVTQERCPPCEKAKALLKRARLPVEVEVIDVARSPFKVRATPTAVLSRDGKEVRRWVGNEVLAELEKYVPREGE